MKKFTFLLAALAISLVTFAQGTITYNLNGGVTNDYGWQDKQDMYESLNADYNTLTGSTAIWTPIEELNSTGAASNQGIPTQVATWDMTFFTNETYAPKWGWLQSYMDERCTIDGKALASAGSANMRYNVTSFFRSIQHTGWPASADYTLAGAIEYFQPTWKHGFCGPAEYAADETVVLPTPYKEGETFLGWYKEADFSGEKVTTISGTGDVVLYAKFGEYIPTIAEVIALADSTETKVQGTVSYVAGSNFWIQDATGGLLCYGKNNGLTEGELVTLSGEKVIYKGSPELNNATVVVKEAGSEVGAQTLLLAAIYADSVNDYATFLNEMVLLQGVTFSRYEDKGSYKTPYVTDGFNEIALYNWNGVTEDKYPVGTKVSVKAVLSIYNTTLQLRGKEAWIEAAAAAGKDNYDYPEVEIDGTKFYLRNNWLYSVNLDNWADNRPNPLAEGSRSVVEKDGILYFSYRDNNTPTERPKLVRVDAKTGKMLDPVLYNENIFKDVNGKWLFGPFTDLKLDNAGNAVTSNLPTAGGAFQVWKVDVETGEGEVLIDLATDSAKFLINQFPDNTTIRLDRIGVYGDVNGDAIVMAAVASGTDVYYWYIEDGEWDGETNWLALAITEKHLDGKSTHFGTAPVICPIEDDYFYVDGFYSYPVLFDPDGNIADAFTEDFEADDLTIGLGGVARKHANNGVTEFEVNGEYYLIIAGEQAPATFVLYKFADEYREFKDMTQMWEFPNAGMGGESNPQRVATSFARPNEEGTAVDIYVFTAENGYGAYTMYIGEEPAPVGVENATLNFNIWVENNTITSDVEINGIYTVTGQNVTTLNGNLSAGAYIVRTAEGVAKVLVK